MELETRWNQPTCWSNCWFCQGNGGKHVFFFFQREKWWFQTTSGISTRKQAGCETKTRTMWYNGNDNEKNWVSEMCRSDHQDISRPLEAAFWLLIFWFNLHFSSFFLVKMKHQILLRLFPRKLGLFSLHSTASSSGQVAVKMVDKVQFWFPELDALDKKQTVPNPLYPGKKHTGFLEVFPWANARYVPLNQW